eukprot:scaffold82565_cov17-Tisochrysis_lutea.AAC.1
MADGIPSLQTWEPAEGQRPCIGPQAACERNILEPAYPNREAHRAAGVNKLESLLTAWTKGLGRGCCAAKRYLPQAGAAASAGLLSGTQGGVNEQGLRVRAVCSWLWAAGLGGQSVDFETSHGYLAGQ